MMQYTRKSCEVQYHFSVPRPAGLPRASTRPAAVSVLRLSCVDGSLRCSMYYGWHLVAFTQDELRMLNIETSPIKPVSLRHRIVEIIRQAITSGDLQPVYRIGELQLAK